jgi:nucleotide-binding universal stress UspA family protein
MAYNRIIVSISGDGSDAAAVETAVQVAHPTNGRLVALYARGETGTSAMFRYPVLGESFFTQVEEAVSETTDKREADARALFDEQLSSALQKTEPRRLGVPVEWIAENADMPEAITRQGGIYDLLVLGPEMRKDPYLMEAALFHSGRPVLVTAENKCPPVNNIMIGWNQSAEAGKSVVNAIPLLQQADNVTICAIRTLAKRGPSAEQCAGYLRAHDVESSIRLVDPSGEAVGALLLNEARRLDADVLVTGANYQSRLQELMPGGVTGYLLQHADIAFIMSH